MKQINKKIVIISAFAILPILFFCVFFLKAKPANNHSSASKSIINDNHQESSIEKTDEYGNLPERDSSQEDELPIISHEENRESEKESNDSYKTKEKNSGSNASLNDDRNTESKEDEVKLPFVRVD